MKSGDRQEPDGVTVCVVDDDAPIRAALERLLTLHGHAVLTFDDAQAYLQRRPDREGPVCLLLDLRMPGMSGIELQDRLHAEGACPAILFLTAHADIPTCVQAMRGGALGFLTKPFDPCELLRAVADGLGAARTLHVEKAGVDAARQRYERLSVREREVCAGVAAGWLNKQIAAWLGIAEKTVKVHRGRVMEKLATSSVPDLVRLVAALDAEQLVPVPEVAPEEANPGGDVR
jgi:FixJ family two-component response regulator